MLRGVLMRRTQSASPAGRGVGVKVGSCTEPRRARAGRKQLLRFRDSRERWLVRFRIAARGVREYDIQS